MIVMIQIAALIEINPGGRHFHRVIPPSRKPL
jgi:hypothetical protein